MKREKGLLVSVYQGGADARAHCLDHLEELAFLCETYDIEQVAKLAVHARQISASTFISQGKVEEILALIADLKPDLVVFDDEISSAQQRNLEKIFGIPVIDRTEVILGIFAERAKTKEAKLQVELAEIKYQAPRLKRMWTHLSRQAATGGGGAYLKGAGEKQIEIDRRLLKDRICLLEKKIDEVTEQRHVQRAQRERNQIPTFAIVGYTNAGKSTLINALTDAEVFVENKLFATLDTTTRKFHLKGHQEILLSDTVGFIRKLPHLVVAAFRSTLEEVVESDVLLHVIDASHPAAVEQAAAALEVLKEIGADKTPIITILNKVDMCRGSDRLLRLRLEHPRTVQISALNREGFDELEEMIAETLAEMRKRVVLRVPQSEYHVVTAAMKKGVLLNLEYDENDVIVEIELPTSLLHTVSKYISHE